MKRDPARVQELQADVVSRPSGERSAKTQLLITDV